MQILFVLLLLGAFHLPVSAAQSEIFALPGSIGKSPVLTMAGPLKTWTPENMYEHINGEAELLKRYGAVSLTYVTYENENGWYLSADILDMGATVNAFGLYRLYAGCDGEEYTFNEATVLAGEYTFYGIQGRYFMRIDFEAGEGTKKGKKLVNDFLLRLQRGMPSPEPLPPAVVRLEKIARKPCEVGYHPEHVDYDLESGPGFSWIGENGGTYFIRLLASPEDTELYTTDLRIKGVKTVLSNGKGVAWSKLHKEETSDYLRKVLNKVIAE